MKKWLLAAALGSILVLGLGACGGGDSESVSAEGEELVKNNCASCHSGDFELVAGDTGYSADEIEDIIKNGKDGMPAIDVSDDEASTIAEYLAD